MSGPKVTTHCSTTVGQYREAFGLREGRLLRHPHVAGHTFGNALADHQGVQPASSDDARPGDEVVTAFLCGGGPRCSICGPIGTLWTGEIFISDHNIVVFESPVARWILSCTAGWYREEGPHTGSHQGDGVHSRCGGGLRGG